MHQRPTIHVIPIGVATVLLFGRFGRKDEDAYPPATSAEPML